MYNDPIFELDRIKNSAKYTSDTNIFNEINNTILNNKDLSVENKLEIIAKKLDDFFNPLIVTFEQIKLNDTLNSNFKLFLNENSDLHEQKDSMTMLKILIGFGSMPFIFSFLFDVKNWLYLLIGIGILFIPVIITYIEFNFFNRALVANLDKYILNELLTLKNKLFKYFSLKLLNESKDINFSEIETFFYYKIENIKKIVMSSSTTEFLETYKSLEISNLSDSHKVPLFRDFINSSKEFNDKMQEVYGTLKELNFNENLKFYENDTKNLFKEIELLKKDLILLYKIPKDSRNSSVKKQINKLEYKFNFLNLINFLNTNGNFENDLKSNSLNIPYKEELEFKLKELLELQIKIKNSFNKDLNNKQLDNELKLQGKTLEFIKNN